MKEKLMITTTKTIKTYMNKFYALFLFVTLASCIQHDSQNSLVPQPGETTVKWDMEEDGKSEARREWFESLHRRAPGVDWEKEVYNYEFQRAQKDPISYNGLRNGSESFANGKLIGEWMERGSSNQAGSVIATEYHTEEDKVYTISAGGSLFKSSLDGFDWEVVNDDLRFNGSILKFIEYQDEERLIALINRTPHYSTDKGETWIPSQGISIDDSWGNCFSPIVWKDEIFMLSKPSYWSALKLYRSTDGGSSYQAIRDLSSHDQALYHLFIPHHSEQLILIEKKDLQVFDISFFNDALDDFEIEFQSTSQGFGEARANMQGYVESGLLYLLYYDGNNQVFKSDNTGKTWQGLGFIPEGPWNVGFYISPSNPNIMLAGGVECHRSKNGGQSWLTVNTWGEYYGDVFYKLHADMMYFKEFTDSEGELFMLISNHGGLSITRDEGASFLNIGLYGLNVSQYYSVRTDPIDREIIYAGAQDQGFQRGRVEFDGPVEFDQTISGDYGHIIFTENGRRMWTVYPGGWITYYSQPQVQNYPSHSYSIESEHESVWIPPIVPHPDPTKNIVFAAGGNINGGEGSHIIQLEVRNGSIVPTQLDFDFRASSGGKIGSIAFSPLNPNYMFVAMDNGNMFYSTDFGQTFKRSVIGVPGSHYLYGTSILPSQVDDQTIYVGGSGYSNSPVVKSTDGGKLFKSMSNGLPPTLVLGLAATPDEAFIFAATETGPFVYVTEDDQWYDLRGEATPAQTYWSVEYLEDQEVVRFGTYGRGIWDFEIEQLSTHSSDLANGYLHAFPNPMTDILNVESTSETSYQIIDNNGRILHQSKANGHHQINVSQWPQGVYHIISNEKSNSLIKL